MSDYRRAHVPGGTFFFTVATHRRRRLFHHPRNRKMLGEAIRACQKDWPFKLNAIVLLPDHLHAICTLPSGDENYSGRWNVIKATFTSAGWHHQAFLVKRFSSATGSLSASAFCRPNTLADKLPVAPRRSR